MAKDQTKLMKFRTFALSAVPAKKLKIFHYFNFWRGLPPIKTPYNTIKHVKQTGFKDCYTVWYASSQKKPKDIFENHISVTIFVQK